MLLVKQVHGARLVDADDVSASMDPVSGPAAGALEADGIVVRRAELLAAVATADCVPILLVAEPRTHGSDLWAACVHAGWRGSLAGIVIETVARARDDGVVPGRLLAALGPSIGPCCYEVDERVAARFRNETMPVIESGDRPHLDLRDINRRILAACGVLPDRIQSVGPCTRCHSESYHSYRADPCDGGRQLSWIGWEAASP